MIDFRSDTVTQPTDAMRAAMASAEVGDDVFRDDPTVNALEAYTAELLGKAAAMFVPTGTQSNLCGLLAHCQRGDEYIVGDHAHTYRYEGGGAAVLGSIQPQPVRMLESGMIDLDQVREVVKPDDSHFARSRLLCVENTTDGKAIDLATLAAGAAVARDLGLSYHLDGARLWNAAVSLDVSPADVAAPFDSVSVCLSKGLGAPVGSVLAASQELIDEARKWRKMLGGGMRQAGIIAAGGQYGLVHHIERLADDHDNAALLAEQLGALEGVEVTAQNTNMVFCDFSTAITRSNKANGSQFADVLKSSHNILVAMSGESARLVVHLGISRDNVTSAVKSFASALSD
ncbi:MAG: low-specificity L-threonine aldolase [Acidimicrobiales bacterium]